MACSQKTTIRGHLLAHGAVGGAAGGEIADVEDSIGGSTSSGGSGQNDSGELHLDGGKFASRDLSLVG